MIRPWHTWVAFGLCLAVVMIAMGWISLMVFRLDRAQALSSQQAALEENIRLALWRIDSAVGPLVARESGHPYFAYRPFHPAERAYTLLFDEIQPGEVLLPSPLLAFESPYILLHFQFTPGAPLTSPQVPTGNMRDLAEGVYTTDEKIEAAAAHLAALRRSIDRDALLSSLPQGRSKDLALAQVTEPEVLEPFQQTLEQRPFLQRDTLQMQAEVQQQRSVVERNVRVQQQVSNVAINDGNTLLATTDVSGGASKLLWVGDSLLLVRRISVRGKDYVQGCWLDWPGISRWLKREIRDLLPHAELEPVRSESPAEETRMLAALPVQLTPGDVPVVTNHPVSPVRLSLLIAWGCVLVAALAVAMLLMGTISLSERRATFVSAVTHEMRTPLTTFRMYAEMLAKGMITDEAKRRHYLDTLGVEAERLSHLVENVLAYARLERNRIARSENVAVKELIDRVSNRLAERAGQAGMNLVVDASDSVLAQRVRADASAVEQILLNLVDNACKYAASGVEKIIHMEVDRAGERAALRIRDHGPGLTKADSRRLFRPFSKSARDAAESAPGVGLGLALSRRLARNMGGDLRLDSDTHTGACFILTLPTA